MSTATPVAEPSLGLDQTVGSLVAATTALESGAAIAGDLDRIFKDDRELDCVVILAGGRPTHLVTREHYYAVTGGPYGFTLYQKKPAEMVAKAQPLVVDESVAVRALAKLALARPRDDQYDPVVVTGGDGLIRGIVTIRQLLLKATELEVQVAQLSNPLTNLPGGRIIHEWLERGLAEDGDGGLTVIFTDLDRFQEYNDVYGLLMGDDLVRRTAAVLASALDLLGPEARLDHDGGDDFVVVSPRTVATDALREICTRFDREKLDLFRAADRERGSFAATDEKGNPIRVPLTTLSLAAITSRSLGEERHPAIFSQLAAGLRRTAKTVTAALGRSAFALNDWRA
ncbi:MAG TPA: diguanylate cyclase [Thermoanaerobaculia bacterium]|jgi:diguanylate cyclase (GGDEF)-like protein|nr:diguanylate cyclase [Thermoanaerobaculia bacterium]